MNSTYKRQLLNIRISWEMKGNENYKDRFR